MRVFMLGWEFPPFITGGLGTACYGLTKALDRRGVEVVFALPKSVQSDAATHVRLLSPAAACGGSASGERGVGAGAGAAHGSGWPHRSAPAPFEHLQFIDVPIEVSGAYETVRVALTKEELRRRQATQASGDASASLSPAGRIVREVLPEAPPPPGEADQPHASGPDYGSDLLGQVRRYARFCLTVGANEHFDVIHAHDWLTYPAGLAIAGVTGKPLVVHVHSTEFDRSGIHVNQKVYDIERRGMHGAMRVIAVSQLTKNVIMRRYGVPDAKVEVVYNGVDLEPTQGEYSTGIQSKDKIVLYFGRITYQKGPEYFIHAARRVLEYMDDVKFVVAGSGDQAARMIEMAANMGIGHKVLFTGFLRGKDIQRVFSLADLYVMPSVSEPFGIAPLEAMGHDVPVLISKSSGVSEVLIHALKCDFWDIDDMADKIIAVLRHPPLQKTLREHGSFEVRRITWDGAASRCEQVYRSVIDEMTHRMQKQHA